MFEEIEFIYERVNATLLPNTTMSAVDAGNISLPQGLVVAMAAVVSGDTEDRIIDLAILNNNSEVVRPCDVRFSEKTAGGTFKDSMRPVSFVGGKTYEARLISLVPSATETVTVQVLFMIQKPVTN